MNNEFNFQPEVPNPYAGFEPNQPKKKKNSFSVASLVLGIVSIAGCCCCCCSDILGLITMGVAGVLAIVFAFVSKKDNENKKMDGKAIAGLILGIIAIVMLLLTLIAVFGAFSVLGSMTEDELLAFFEENLKPMVDEETYNDFIEAFKEGYAIGSGEAAQ